MKKSILYLGLLLVLCSLSFGLPNNATLNSTSEMFYNYDNLSVVTYYNASTPASYSAINWYIDGSYYADFYFPFMQNTTAASVQQISDASGNNFNATLYGTPTYHRDNFTGYYDLESGGITLNNNRVNFGGNEDFSILMWVKFGTWPGVNSGVISFGAGSSVKSNPLSIWRTANTGINAYVGNGTTYSNLGVVAGVLELEKWKLLKIKYDASERQMWFSYDLNSWGGVEIISSAGLPVITNNASINIGSYGTPASYTNMSVGPIRLYNRLITDEEVAYVINMDVNNYSSILPSQYVLTTEQVYAKVTPMNDTYFWSALTTEIRNITFDMPHISQVNLTSSNCNYDTESTLNALAESNDSDYITYNFIRNGVSYESVHITFDENITTLGNTITDFSGNSVATIINNSMNYSNTECVVNGCYYFNRSGHINISDSKYTDLLDNFTIMFWMKSPGWTVAKNVLGKGTTTSSINYNFWMPDNTFRFYRGNGSLWTSTTLLDATDMTALQDEWFHVTVVKSGTTGTFYLNGIENSTFTIYETLANNTNTLTIGAGKPSINVWDGGIDEVHIIQTDISEDQIMDIYSSELAGKPYSTINKYELSNGDNWAVDAYGVNITKPIQSTIPPLRSTSYNITYTTDNNILTVIPNTPSQDRDLSLYCTPSSDTSLVAYYSYDVKLNGNTVASGDNIGPVTAGNKILLHTIDKYDLDNDDIVFVECIVNNTLTESTKNLSIKIGSQSIIYIATTGSDTTGDGSDGSPYKTIFKAMSMANYSDIIIFKSGSYDLQEACYNSVDVTKGVVIKGQDNVFLNFTGGDSIFNIKNSNVRIEHLNINASELGQNSIVVEHDTEYIDIVNNSIIDGITGVLLNENTLRGVNNIDIIGNYFYHNAGYFVDMVNGMANNVNISSNMINSTLTDVTLGLYFNEYSENNTYLIYNNTFYYDTISKIERVIDIEPYTNYKHAKITIANNTVGSVDKLFYGDYFIYSSYTDNLTVSGNTFLPSHKVDSVKKFFYCYDYCNNTNILYNKLGSADNRLYNVTVSGSGVYFYGGNNTNITGNEIYIGNNFGSIRVGSSVSYPVYNLYISNNYVNTNTNNVSYPIGVGSESSPSGDETTISGYIFDPKIIGNNVSAPANGGTPNHGIFVGYTVRPYIADNYVDGGLYTYVIKGNVNGLVVNNTGKKSDLGMYDKGCFNMTYLNNKLYGNSVTDKSVYITYGNTYEDRAVKNSVWYNTLWIDDEGDRLASISGFENATSNVTFINATKLNTSSGIISPIGTSDVTFGGSNLTYYQGWYYDVTVLNSLDNDNPISGASLRIIDNNDDVVVTAVTDSDGKISNTPLIEKIVDVKVGDDVITYKNYTLSVTYNGVTTYNNTEFNITYNSLDNVFYVSYNVNPSDLDDGINGVKFAVFAAFSLFALISVITAAFVIYKLLESGADSSVLLITTVGVIALGITLIVGYIIISIVANSIV